jgi:hypothetical protein
MSSGQLALQNQFDVNNENLAKTRTRLLDQMAGFDTDKQDAIKRADTGIQEAQNKFRNDQSTYNDYLMGLQNEFDSSIADQESKARGEYQNTFTTGQSGNYGKFNDPTWWSWAQANSLGAGANEQILRAQQGNYWGDNLTWNQLQNERSLSPNLTNAAGQYGLQSLINAQERNRSSLDNFYKEQDEKYGMTADSEERAYNTLSEILGSLNKKEKGFKVRG